MQIFVIKRFPNHDNKFVRDRLKQKVNWVITVKSFLNGSFDVKSFSIQLTNFNELSITKRFFFEKEQITFNVNHPFLASFHCETGIVASNRWDPR